MHISADPLTPANLPCCAALWPDRAAFTDHEFAAGLSTCEDLLRDGRALGSTIREDRRVRAFGVSTFVQERFADEYFADPHPQVGKRVLLEAPATDIVLDWRGVAERNAAKGLQLVVVSAMYDVAACDPMLVVGTLIRAFIETHRGYRIQRIINEVIGVAGVHVVTRGAAFDVHRTFEEIVHGTALPSAVCVLTRARAEARHSPLVGMFAYNAPRAQFTRAEQQLLRAALDGAPDDIVSARLELPVSAVKARWTRIHQRVAKCLPELVETVRAPHLVDRRGAQSRHLILAYVRENPSELTPYARRPGEC